MELASKTNPGSFERLSELGGKLNLHRAAQQSGSAFAMCPTMLIAVEGPLQHRFNRRSADRASAAIRLCQIHGSTHFIATSTDADMHGLLHTFRPCVQANTAQAFLRSSCLPPGQWTGHRRVHEYANSFDGTGPRRFFLPRHSAKPRLVDVELSLEHGQFRFNTKNDIRIFDQSALFSGPFSARGVQGFPTELVFERGGL